MKDPATIEERANAVQAAAAQAFRRLVELAENHRSGQAARIARFLASTYDGETFPFDPFDLRTVDVAIGDDMLTCLDALRWGKADLHKLLPDGQARLLKILEDWDIEGPGSAG